MKRIFMIFLMVIAVATTICAQKVITNYPTCASGAEFKVEVQMKPADYKQFMQLVETVKQNQARIDLAMNTQVTSPTGSESVLLGKQLMIGNYVLENDNARKSMDKILEKYLTTKTIQDNKALYNKKRSNKKR